MLRVYIQAVCMLCTVRKLGGALRRGFRFAWFEKTNNISLMPLLWDLYMATSRAGLRWGLMGLQPQAHRYTKSMKSLKFLIRSLSKNSEGVI